MRRCERFGFLSFICQAFSFFFLEGFYIESTSVGGLYIHMDLSGDNLHFVCC